MCVVFFFFLVCLAADDFEKVPAESVFILIDLTGGGGRAEKESRSLGVPTEEERDGEEELRDVDAEAAEFCGGDDSQVSLNEQ